MRKASGWVHLSVGRLLRVASEPTDPRQAADSGLIMAHIAAGNLVPQVRSLDFGELVTIVISIALFFERFSDSFCLYFKLLLE